MQDDIRTRILAFAAQIDGPGADAARSARSRRWLSDTGEVTEDGQALIAALLEQAQTRSVFRGL